MRIDLHGRNLSRARINSKSLEDRQRPLQSGLLKPLGKGSNLLLITPYSLGSFTFTILCYKKWSNEAPIAIALKRSFITHNSFLQN